MMSPDKIENPNYVYGLTSVDLTIDTKSDSQENKKQKKKKKFKRVNPEDLIEDELTNTDDDHIDFHA